MRRLPVYFLLDCSESMAGENLAKMQQGLQAIIRDLRRDPHALESVHVGVIAFAGVAKALTGLIELPAFYPPRLPLGGGTSLGGALLCLMDEIDHAVVRTTATHKGDWKPLVYLFTDGRPTDDCLGVIQRWRKDYDTRAHLIAIGLGKDADYAILKQLTDTVLTFEDTHEEDFTRLVSWVTASIAAQSRSVVDTNPVSLAKEAETGVVQLVKDPPQAPVDEACVTLIGRCQKHRKPYLIKYERQSQELGHLDFHIDVPSVYRLAGCLPLDEDYFAWSDPRASNVSVNTSGLIGAPSCPYCGNATAFAMCGCGKLMCTNGDGGDICPWCGSQVNFVPGPAPDEGGFDVERGRG